MAPSIKFLVAGVTVLVAALGQHADAQTPTTAVDTTICLNSFNKARAARLDVRESTLTTKTGGTDAQDAVLAALAKKTDNTTCTLKATTYPTTADVAGFLYLFKEKESSALTEADCDAAVQEQLALALTQIGDNSDKPFTADQAPYTNTNTAAQNFAYMMDSKATQVQCAFTNNCVDKNTFLVCRFTPAISSGAVPFAADFFAAVKARSAAGLTIPQLTVENIGQPLTGSDSSAKAVVPAIAVVLSLLGLLNL